MAVFSLMGCASKLERFPPLPPVKPALRKIAKVGTSVIPTSFPVSQIITAPLDNGWGTTVLGPGTNSTGAQSEY